MEEMKFAFYGRQAIIRSRGTIPQTSAEITKTDLFKKYTSDFLENLRKRESPLLEVFPKNVRKGKQDEVMLDLLQRLAEMTKEEINMRFPRFSDFFRDTYLLNQFVETLYNYWRSFERFLVCYSDQGMEMPLDKKPYRTFNETVELLNHLVRKAYRDISENITGDHPRIYRQVAAGCQVGIIAAKKDWPCPAPYSQLKGIPFIRQVLIEPPLILDPPMNSRSGEFKKVDSNPLKGINMDSGEWLCYPAKVCDMVVHIFFHFRFMGLGTSLANLFELASDQDLQRKPDAVYAFGVPPDALKKYGKPPTVFFDDEKNGLLVAAVPGTDEFGYFGYLKKMILTLHNIAAMKKGRLPVHGAMVRIILKNGKAANVILWGDTGAGKSESIEAFRVLGDQYIRDMTIIFDDMGSLKTKEGKVIAYGTETGAFVRLDDLHPGFAFGNIDRSIIMSPQKTNARVVIPITTLQEVSEGHPVDFLLYANNYENVDEKHPYLEFFKSAEEAIGVFRYGARMAKGTTGDEKGIVNSYFANIFGPAQYKEMHEKLAGRYFRALFEAKVKVGQLRTMLGIQGYETKGPESAAKAIFEAIGKS